MVGLAMHVASVDATRAILRGSVPPIVIRTSSIPALARVRADATRSAWAVWLAVWTGLALVYLGVPGDGQEILYDAFALGAFVATMIGVRLHAPPRRMTWHVLGLGALALAA